MTDAGGYVTEIAYTHGFHAQMAPGPVPLALALRGVEPPDFSRPFTWCELGFGQGVNLALLAACHPQGRFYGNDILPAHVETARSLAAAAGAANLHVTADSFASYLEAPLPPMDVIALHGVWSWVGAENRGLVVEFIRRRLKPGGVVYVSYNALPGWSHHLPLRHLMKAHVDQDAGPLAEQIGRALDFAGRVAAAGGGYFAATPTALDRLGDLKGRPAGYLAHEYFNRHWDPQHFSEAAGELARAGLAFAAPALPSDHLDHRALPPERHALLREVGDPLLRETVRDFLTNQPFRRDLFTKAEEMNASGLPPVRAQRQAPAPALFDIPFAALAPAHRVPGMARLPQGEFALDRDLCLRLMESLAEAPRSAASLAPSTGRSAEEVAEALVALAALNLAAPAVGTPHSTATASAFNAHVLELARGGDTISALAAPVLGSGVETERVERLFLLALRQESDPVAFAWSVLSGRGERLVRDGRLLSSAADNLEELGDRWHRFGRERLPVLQALGAA